MTSQTGGRRGGDREARILNWLETEFRRRNMIGFESHERHRVLDAIAVAEAELRHCNEVEINVPFVAGRGGPPVPFSVRLSRAKLHELLGDDRQASVRQPIRLTSVTVDISGRRPESVGKRTRADLTVCIDTTGSMSDKIEGLLQTCQRFVDQLAHRNVDWQAAVVAFGDLTVPGDRIVATAFSSDVGQVQGTLRRVPRFAGGANEGESSLEAVRAALSLKGYRSEAVRVLILITDEPALQHTVRARDVIAEVRHAGFLCFVVSPALAYFQQLARDCAGTWFEISARTDLSSILRIFDHVARDVASTVHNVERLTGGNAQEYLRLPPARRRGE
jgi:hypothetical protein